VGLGHLAACASKRHGGASAVYVTV
jgi:hypothetical protein